MKRKNTVHLAPFGIFHQILCLVGFFMVSSLYQCTDPDSENTASTPDEFSDSISYYTRQVERQPDKSIPLFHRAKHFYERGAYDAALKDLQNALHIDSTHLETYLLKSQIEMDYFRSRAALKTLQKAEIIWPNSIEVKEDLAKTHLILKQYTSAREAAQKALEINPFSAKPHLFLGLIEKENQDTATAISHFQSAVQNNADLLDAWVELAKLKMSTDPDEAVPYFESALQIEPDNVHLWHTYATYWQSRDSLARAKECYKLINELDPEYKEAYFNKALILMDQDSFLTAIPVWDQYILKETDQAQGYYYRGISHEMVQNYPAALNDYREARERDPGLEQIEDAIKSMEQKIR